MWRVVTIYRCSPGQDRGTPANDDNRPRDPSSRVVVRVPGVSRTVGRYAPPAGDGTSPAAAPPVGIYSRPSDGDGSPITIAPTVGA